VLQKDLSRLPSLFFETEKENIACIEHTVNEIYEKFIV
jgi:hypothetical protein